MNLPGEGVRGTALWSLPQSDEGKGEACPRQKTKKTEIIKCRQSYSLPVQIQLRVLHCKSEGLRKYFDQVYGTLQIALVLFFGSIIKKA